MEHNFVTLIRARARCTLPMTLEFHPVAWLHIPICLDAVDEFTDWDETVILRILTAVVQGLGGRRRGKAPSGLHYPYVSDMSRMYCERPPAGHSQNKWTKQPSNTFKS